MSQETDQYLSRLMADDELYCAKNLKIRDKNGELHSFIWNEAQRMLHGLVEKQKAQRGWVRVLVLKGAGDDFSAGADLSGGLGTGQAGGNAEAPMILQEMRNVGEIVNRIHRMAKPTLAVYNAAGELVASAASWRTNFSSAQRAGIELLSASVGAFALAAGSDDAVLHLRLVPGSYTVQVASSDAGSGVALMEVYASSTFMLPP